MLSNHPSQGSYKTAKDAWKAKGSFLTFFWYFFSGKLFKTIELSSSRGQSAGAVAFLSPARKIAVLLRNKNLEALVGGRYHWQDGLSTLGYTKHINTYAFYTIQCILWPYDQCTQSCSKNDKEEVRPAFRLAFISWCIFIPLHSLMAAVLIWFFLIHQTTLTVKELCRTKRTSTEVDKVSLGNQETYGATSNKDSTSFIQDDESGRDSLLRKASFHSQSPEYNKEFTYHFLYRYALITVQIIGIAVLPTLFWQAYITSEAPLAFLFNSFHARSTVEKVFIELYYSHFASSALLIVYALALDIAYFSVLYPTLLVKNSPSPPSRERGIPMSRSQNSLSNVEDEDRNRGAFLDSKP